MNWKLQKNNVIRDLLVLLYEMILVNLEHNRKVINCGTFKDEIDVYNLKAEELTKLETTKIKYELNNLEL